MNIVLNIMGTLSIVLLLCTILCGVWMKYHPQEDKNFHFKLSLSSVVLSLVTIVLFMINY